MIFKNLRGNKRKEFKCNLCVKIGAHVMDFIQEYKYFGIILDKGLSLMLYIYIIYRNVIIIDFV